MVDGVSAPFGGWALGKNQLNMNKNEKRITELSDVPYSKYPTDLPVDGDLILISSAGKGIWPQFPALPADPSRVVKASWSISVAILNSVVPYATPQGGL